MAGAALGVASQLDRDDLGVGGFDSLIDSHDVRACPGAATEDTDGAILRVQTHDLVEGRVQVRNHQADGVAKSRANEFGHAGGFDAGKRAGRRCGLAVAAASRHLLHDLLHDEIDQFVIHVTHYLLMLWLVAQAIWR